MRALITAFKGLLFAGVCLTIFGLCMRTAHADIALTFGPSNYLDNGPVGDTKGLGFGIIINDKHEVECGHVMSRDNRLEGGELEGYEFCAYQRRFYTKRLGQTDFRFFGSFGGSINNSPENAIYLPASLNFREKLGFQWKRIEVAAEHDSNSGLFSPNRGETGVNVRWVSTLPVKPVATLTEKFKEWRKKR